MKINKVLRGRYAKIAHRWNCSEYNGLRCDDLIPKIIKYSNLKSLSQEPTILEAMCGTGKIGEAITAMLKKQEKKPFLYFLDFSQAMLDQITIPAEKVLGDVRKMPFMENFFDRIFLRGGLHDLPKESQLEAIGEIHRVLKHDGLFILIVSHTEKETHDYFNKIVCLKDTLAGNYGGMQRYFATKKEYHKLLLLAGFRNIQNPLNYEGEITYSATIELDREGNEKIDGFFKQLPKKIKQIWKVRESKRGITFNFPYAVLAAKK